MSASDSCSSSDLCLRFSDNYLRSQELCEHSPGQAVPRMFELQTSIDARLSLPLSVTASLVKLDESVV